MIKKRKTVGLALGSGGVKGFAHIGVLETLLKNNIPIDYIAGSSIGAWVGANYALFQDIDTLKEMTVGNRKEKFACLWDLGITGGLIRGDKVKKLLFDWLGESCFEDTHIPFKAVATDLITGEPHIFSTGQLTEAVRASMAIPTMFKPVEFEKKSLVDGGLCYPLPTKIVRDMGADIVIAVNLDNYQKNSRFKKEDVASIVKISSRSFDIMRHYLAQDACKEADIVIEPKTKDNDATIWKEYFLNGQGEHIVEAGKKEAESVIKKIKKLITS